MACHRGRDAELAALGELLGRLGSGAVLVIEGPAGMGKSRVIGEGVRMAHRASVAAGVGAPEPWERGLAIGVARVTDAR